MTKNEMLHKCAELCLDQIERDFKGPLGTCEQTINLIDKFLLVLDEIKE